MIRTFSDWVRRGRSGANWSEIALKTQLVIDAWSGQLGADAAARFRLERAIRDGINVRGFAVERSLSSFRAHNPSYGLFS